MWWGRGEVGVGRERAMNKGREKDSHIHCPTLKPNHQREVFVYKKDNFPYGLILCNFASYSIKASLSGTFGKIRKMYPTLGRQFCSG